jgi:CheY-like chemotaxis protein
MEQPEAKGRTVLIVDDDTFLLDMYAMRFAQAGFTVDTSMSAKQTIEKLKGGYTPDILISDVVMPSVDGFEMMEEINSLGLAKGSIKIYLSNLGQEADVERGTSLGAVGYIVKANSTPSEVVAKVLEILKEHTV